MGCSPSLQKPECQSPNFQFPNSSQQFSPLVMQYQHQKMRQRKHSKQNLHDQSQ